AGHRSSIISLDTEEPCGVSQAILDSVAGTCGDGGSSDGTCPYQSRKETRPKTSQEASSHAVPSKPVARKASCDKKAPGTIILSGKFVSELKMLAPSSEPGCRDHYINLGIFIATDRLMGDHTIYKISPHSPLSSDIL
ncbi:unnamed protein product, partial [Meganyctiphanes norvegica]